MIQPVNGQHVHLPHEHMQSVIQPTIPEQSLEHNSNAPVADAAYAQLYHNGTYNVLLTRTQRTYSESLVGSSGTAPDADA